LGLNKVVFSAGYDHENFIPVTTQFDYLNRASEWFTASASLRIGDSAQTGLEAQASRHDYERETVLNNNWRARVGPFVEVNSEEKIGLRPGAVSIRPILMPLLLAAILRRTMCM